MKKKIRSIKRDINRRKNFLKNEIKIVILKSIIQNLNLKPKIRSNSWVKLIKLRNVCFLSKQNNNLCLNSGRFKGVIKKTNLCRHEMKKLGLTGYLQNFKIKSW